MAAFDFVTDADLRAGLAADYRELERCFDSGAWKAVHVLAGSIVEAVLADYLISSGAKPADAVLKWTLGKIVEESQAAGVLSRRTVDLSSAVREYRNLIHPGRAVRLSVPVDKNAATVVKALVDIVAQEVAEQKRRAYGYTAEQLLSKLERDRSVVPLLKHLASETKPIELKRLLKDLIPQRIIKTADDDSTDPSEARHLSACHRSLLEIVDASIRQELAQAFVEEVKDGSSFTIQVYLDHLFRADDLAHLSTKQHRIALDRLLAELKDAASAKSIPECVMGLGRHIADEDVNPFVDPIARAMVAGAGAGALAAEQYLRFEYAFTRTGTDKAIAARLKRWEPAAQRQNDPAVHKRLSDLIGLFESSSDLPF